MISDKIKLKQLFLMCWLVYFITYIGRLSYTCAMADMIADNVITKPQAGSISMIFFFSYGIGQLVNGFLGDRLSPVHMIAAGLSLSSLCNLIMGLNSNYYLMAAVWGISGFSQAMVWPPIMRLFSTEFDEQSRLSACVNIATTMAAGTLCSYILSALLLSISGWRLVFLLPAVLIALTAAFCSIGISRILKTSARAGRQAERALPKPQNPAPKPGGIRTALFCGLVPLIILPAIVHGMIKDGVTSWVPTFISERFGVIPALSILITTLLPVANMFGAYAAGFVHKRVKNECLGCAIFFGIASVALLALNIFGGAGALFSAALLAVITSSMIAVNTLIVSFVPLRYSAAGLSATVSGFLNSMAYIGAAISSFAVGVMVEKLGWGATTISWFVACALAALLSLLPPAVKQAQLKE